MSAPKERPILFSGSMVRAILDEEKTQTRRIMNPQAWGPVANVGLGRDVERFHWHRRGERTDGGFDLGTHIFGLHPETQRILVAQACPYGAPGDRLWLRETWAPVDRMSSGVEREEPVEIGYMADLSAISHESDNVHSLDVYGWNWEAIKWRPSIFMPRWASRITLEVVSVRVERLQDISEDDARAEGVRPFFERFPMFGQEQCITSGERAADAPFRASFAVLWDEINGDRATWKSNPWVWVVNFKKIEVKP